MNRSESGMTLLEVLAALAIAGSAGIMLVTTLAATVRAFNRAHAEERMVGAAGRLLAAHSLLSSIDLDRRLGRREIGELDVQVERPESGLYRIAVAERSAPDVELLVTVVHRRDTTLR